MKKKTIKKKPAYMESNTVMFINPVIMTTFMPLYKKI